ncbi:BPTD_3080 family restriction endonuclease [Planctomyces sp. SH-PL62]|uniref:BPTD_3080 family restriction endonuclease n=1 Tax=Planctomyces sp. SH-PL62 TaxID=1636152 RepID=UPI00078D2071|nr:DEAD/DEAH box helicase family protein [Planctomyces sp. SH-PL62]AMV38779.1 Type III restriction enzyme, res subunit [Planctomyces sp. SH-PL62]
MSSIAAITNPILNSPYREPTKHFRFTADNQITSIVDSGRRDSSYFLPIASPKKKSVTPLFDAIEEQRTESGHVNRIRQLLKSWRDLGRPDITPVTRALLDHWHAEDRFRALFFCQLEALETLIYITEVAKQTKYGDVWIENYLREKAEEAGTDLFRVACKMATGSGKTVVMSMLIAWQVLNKRRYPRDNRFTDAFLVVAPGITIRDRLRVLLPSDPNNYYRELDVVPAEYRGDLGTARIVVTNYHAFKLREKGDAGGLTKRLLTVNTPGAFTESPDEMVNRVCNDLGKHREIMVINDEAHHCYRGRPVAVKEKLTREEASEARDRAEEARLWITGLEAIHRKIGVKAVYDLSATPFYLKGSGYPEGTLFPWVVSDFSLMDAIESGIVKIPRVPVADNAMTGDYPKYRDLWVYIRDGLKDVRRGPADANTPPLLPGLLEGALKSLYGHYARKFADWEADEESRANGGTPPVFIVVCNNTNVSKAVFDYVSGYETGHKHPDGEPVVAGGDALPLFGNVKDQRWLHRPNTILVDSRQLESGDSMSDEFKRLAKHQIEEFKAEYRRRFPGRDAESLTDEDLMREVLNTVGKPGKLGEHVRCVVSVSMLTEGWDCNTVTHILGVRAFGTRLLCEQVMGRGLRRRSYAVGDDGMMAPEYADIFGVPFTGFPVAGLPEERAPAAPKPGKAVRAVPERLIDAPWLEVTFPRVVGYRFDVPADRLAARFDATHREVLTTQDIPTNTLNAPIVGEKAELTLGDAKVLRPQAVTFRLATHLQQRHFPDKPWLFPQLVGIVRDWLGDPDGESPNVEYGDDTFPGLLLLGEKKHAACEKINRAIIAASGGAQRLRAELQRDDAVGTTAGVSFDTVKTCWTTEPTKCHVNLVPQDSDWETIVCQKLEEMDEVRAYAKNQGIGFRIPYTLDGRPGNYFPDLVVKLDDGRGPDDLLNLVLEVSGQKKKEKDAKVQTAKTMWVPGVNNLGTFGRWAFLEIDGSNLHKTKQEIRSLLEG